MKLVDILARELKRWPKCVTAIAQDSDGYAHPYDGLHISFDGYAWSGNSRVLPSTYRVSMEEADDYRTSVVTRSQWQAAVDALKAGEQDWDGEWKPPVGTVCEVPDGPDYREATIIAYYKDMAVFAFDDIDGHPYVETCLPLECRRIRTAEQIEAQEREAGIQQLQIDHGVRARDGGRLIAEKLWDMGYRKQEAQQ